MALTFRTFTYLINLWDYEKQWEDKGREREHAITSHSSSSFFLFNFLIISTDGAREVAEKRISAQRLYHEKMRLSDQNEKRGKNVCEREAKVCYGVLQLFYSSRVIHNVNWNKNARPRNNKNGNGASEYKFSLLLCFSGNLQYCLISHIWKRVRHKKRLVLNSVLASTENENGFFLTPNAMFKRVHLVVWFVLFFHTFFFRAVRRRNMNLTVLAVFTSTSVEWNEWTSADNLNTRQL